MKTVTIRQYLALGASILGSMSVYGMDAEWAERFQKELFNAEFMKGAAQESERIANNIRDHAEEEAKRQQEEINKLNRQKTDKQKEINELMTKLDQLARTTPNSPMVAVYTQRLKALQAEETDCTDDLRKRATDKREDEKAMKDLANTILKKGVDIATSPFDMLKKAQEQQAQLNQEAVKAHQQAQASVKTAEINAKSSENKLQKILDNKYAIAGAGTVLALGIFGAQRGTTLLADYIKRLYTCPVLAEETSILTFSQKVGQKLLGAHKVTDKVSDVILAPALAERINTLTLATQKTVQNNTFFSNVMFYGKPGTGKTMLAKKIARISGMDYVYFTAPGLLKFSLEDGLIELDRLITFAKRSSRKVMFIIDEAELLFANRDNEQKNRGQDDKSKQLLRALLGYTGTESKDFMFVLLTNRPQDFDKAALSRMAAPILIPVPTKEERKLIIDKYMKDYILTAPVDKVRNLTVLGSLLGRFNKKPTVSWIKAHPHAVGPQMVQWLADQTEGFVGRDISYMVLGMQAAALVSNDRTLTPLMVETALAQFLEKQRLAESGFAQFATA